MRGQTTLDFAVGISVFLLTLASVLSFVPGMLQPFGDHAPEDTAFGTRMADQLSGSVLAEPGESPILDVGCTLEFFRAIPTGSHACSFDQSVAVPDQHDPALGDRLGVSARHRLAVTVEGDADGDGTADTLCWDEATDRPVEASDGDCEPADGDVQLAIATSEPPTGTGSVVVTRRVVVLTGQDATLEVRAW